MNTLFDVKKTVRSLVGDDDGSWTTDSYLLPKINLAYRTQTTYIKKATGQNLERMVEIPAATDANGNPTTQGLTSLANLQQPGKLLEGLYQPLFLWWKLAGQPESCYRQLIEKKTLPLTTPQTNATLPAPWPLTQMYFTWRRNQLFVTPLNQPVDLLVDGRFNPPALVKNEDVLVVHPDMDTAVAPATVAIIGLEAGNPGYQQTGQAMAEEACDNIRDLLIMEKQGYTARAGRNARGWTQRRGWFWY